MGPQFSQSLIMTLLVIKWFSFSIYFISPELKAHMIFSDRWSSGIYPSVSNFFTILSSQEPQDQFNQSLVTGVQICSSKGPRLFQGEIIMKYRQKKLRTLNTFVSVTTRRISIKLGTKHSWVIGILECSNK